MCFFQKSLYFLVWYIYFDLELFLTCNAVIGVINYDNDTYFIEVEITVFLYMFS